MTKPSDDSVFRPLLSALGSSRTLARLLGASPSTVDSWMRRDSVPAYRWKELADLAKRQGVAVVTLQRLSDAGAVVAQRTRANRTGRMAPRTPSPAEKTVRISHTRTS